MNPNNYDLGLRERGQTVPVSIGSALAIEAALGVYPERPQTPMPLGRYDEVWVNVYTVFRNLYGSLTAEAQKGVLPGEMYLGMKDDMAGIEFALSQAKPKIRVVFYLNDYSGLARKYPDATIKFPQTLLQKQYAEIEHDTLTLLSKRPPEGLILQSDTLAITGNHKAALIITHFAVDLLARYQFSRLDLLESHSGAIKPSPMWNTKLGTAEIKHLPFHAFTLQIFGDKSTQFVAQPLALRKAILKLAEDRAWTPMTSMMKIVADIKASNDPFLILAAKPFW